MSGSRLVPPGSRSSSSRGFPWLKRVVIGFTVSPRLPDELLDMVLGYCDAPTLAVLARCNTEVHARVIPPLYRSIVLNTETLKRLRYGLSRSHPGKSIYHQPTKWCQYKTECLRLTKHARVAGKLSSLLIDTFLPKFADEPVLFPSVDSLCLEDAISSSSLDLCVKLFRPRHLCIIRPPDELCFDNDLFHGDKPINELHRLFTLSVETLSLHSDGSVYHPCFSFQNLRMRIFRASSAVPDWITIPTSAIADGIYGGRPLCPPLSIETIGTPSPDRATLVQIENDWQIYCDSVEEVGEEARDILGTFTFTPTAKAEPCIVCGGVTCNPNDEDDDDDEDDADDDNDDEA